MTAAKPEEKVPPADPAAKAELDRAFEDLYRAHLRDVYSYSYYRVGNHHDAEDLTEQTFLQAYRHFERARREFMDGLTKLPDDRREALIMRFALGMDNREIARALGRSDGATKVLIHRAIKQLEELLADE